MGLLDSLNFSQPFRISSLLPSESQLQAYKQKSDAEALAQFGQDPNPIRRVPFNILTALGVNPTIAQAAPTTLDVAPVTGDISALADARTAFGQGDLATAGLLTAATLIPGVPAGKVKGLLKKSDDTKPLLNVDDAPKEGIANVVPPTDTDSGIIAFHGSGADFDQFRMDKIGTGEGAQAFGYGLYFTDSEDIAKFYKNAMSRNVDIDGKPYIRGNKINDELVDPDIADDLGATNGDLEAAIKSSEDFLQEMIAADNVTAIRSTSKELEKLKQLRGRISINETAGKTYKVALAPKPDELLDFDLPLNEQSDEIKVKFINALENLQNKNLDASLLNEVKVHQQKSQAVANLNKKLDNFVDQLPNEKAKKIYKELIDEVFKDIPYNVKEYDLFKEFEEVVPFNKYPEIDANIVYDIKRDLQAAKPKTIGEILPTDKITSEALSKAGIKGIKYKAGQLSGVKDTDATNYVIFDENLINVLAKYGIVGSVGITALQNSDI